MNFYEIKLNVVIDRNPPQALKHLRSALEEIFDKNAEIKDGMLKIKLEKVIPEHKKPKLIDIK